MQRTIHPARRRASRRIITALTASALIASGCSLAAVAPASAATTEVLKVNFAQSTGDFKGGASGMLYGLSDDGVPTDAIIAGAHPLNITQKAPHGAQHPNGDPLDVEDSFFDNGGEYIMTNIQDYYPDWAYNGGRRPSDFNTYLDIVRTVVTSIVTESDHPEKYVFTPFNEPDGGNWYNNWGTMKDTFLADWKAAYGVIKEVYPEAKIAGPGDASWHADRTRDLLTYAKANNVLPDIVTWHELGISNLATYRSHYNQYRQIERDLGISPLKINITEYAMRRDMSVPGQLVQWLAMFEDTKVDAQTAYWTFAGNLNDNSAKSNSANGAWWLLKWYGDLDGETVSLTPPALNTADTLQGIATVDDEKKQATVLFGGTSNAVQLDLSGLDPAVFGDSVDIQVREAEWSGQEGEAPAPRVVGVQRAQLGAGAVTVNVPNDDRLSAYQAVITPALGTAPTADTTWTVSTEAENTVLKDVSVYNQPLSNDWLFAASGQKDVGSTNKVTSSLTWSVDVPTAGKYRFGAIAGVNGPTVGPGTHALFVDGTYAADIKYEAGFGWAYRGRAEAVVDLTAGRHDLSVRMSANGTSLLPGSDISLDKFDLTRLDGPETTTYPAVLARTGDAPVSYAGAGSVRVAGAASASFYPSVHDNGYYDVALKYTSTSAAAVKLSINGRPIQGLLANKGGEWTSVARVHLAKGISHLEISSPEGIDLASVTTTRAADADSNTVTIEAEDAAKVTLNGTAKIENVAQPTNVSGRQLGWLGGNANNYATVARPSQLGAGQYDLSVRYSNAEKNTGHAYNADIITRFLDVSEAGGDTTRGAFRHNYSWRGFWTHTVPLDLTTASGSLKLGNATGNAPNIDWLQLSPLSVGVTNTVARVAPVVTPTAASAQPGENGWNRAATELTLASSDPDSTVQYQVDDGEWKAYTAPVAFAEDGTFQVGYRALVDGSPVASSAGTIEVKVDATAPSTSVETDPASGTVTEGSTIKATFTATDQTSGVARTEYSVNGGEWQVADAAGVSFGEKGSYTVQYRSVDSAGNVEQAKSVVLTVAARAATATVKITSADTPTADGWYNQSVLVALTAPAGTKAQYRIDGGAWKAYSSSVTVSADGQHLFDHRLLKSNAVVDGSQAQVVIKIDKTVPTAKLTRSPASGAGTPLNPIEVELSATDKLSGVGEIEYRLNSGAWASYTEPVVLNEVGDYVVSYRATDLAGNTSAAKSATVTIKADAPATIKPSATTVTRGKTVTVSITGFVRWSDVTFTLGGRVIGTAITDQVGSARVTLRIPADQATGAAPLTAAGESNVTATAQVTVK